MPAQSQKPQVDTNNAVWYLGIDLGTTGISAVLLNYSTGQRYPIYWSQEVGITGDQLTTLNSPGAAKNSGEVLFRLPTLICSELAHSKEPLAMGSRSASSKERTLVANRPKVRFRVCTSTMSLAPVSLGFLAASQKNDPSGICLKNFKPYLNLGIPYYLPKHDQWEPKLQVHTGELVSLYWLQQALQALLATLTPANALHDAELKLGAVGLKLETLRFALEQLEGVVVGSPASWGDTYRLNLREALLAIELVRRPEQVFFLEDAIATVLAGLGAANQNWGLGIHSIQQPTAAAQQRPTTDAANLPTNQPQNHSVSSEEFSLSPLQSPIPSALTLRRGGTLVINAGATTTELALVDLPDNLQNLTHSDFSLSSLAYGGNALDQDIFCQLLYPRLSEQQRQRLSLSRELQLPLPGQPDQQKRDRLALLLQSSSLGQALLQACEQLKLTLQTQEEFTLELGTDQLRVKRKEVESHVVLPFIQQLNRELNALIVITGISDKRISQVLCVGGTAVLGRLEKWLQQKLPKASIIQNADSPTGSWVAAGLASLPFYPQVLNRSRQQYSDYFLLAEILRAFGATPGKMEPTAYSIEEIMQQLERRGLNTESCYERLVSLLEGQLPDGLVPPLKESIWLSQESKQNRHYSELTAKPLFSQEANQLYRPNGQQQERMRWYLEILLSRTRQKFQEPLTIPLGSGQLSKKN
ncbi:hypothetical protein [Lyngbya aestuarii]|uniref:hypothetical protein n=1 Tax=Lyngbya aestuarii TaxID=118322 RepID=UPI00403DE593